MDAVREGMKCKKDLGTGCAKKDLFAEILFSGIDEA